MTLAAIFLRIFIQSRFMVAVMHPCMSIRRMSVRRTTAGAILPIIACPRRRSMGTITEAAVCTFPCQGLMEDSPVTPGITKSKLA